MAIKLFIISFLLCIGLTPLVRHIARYKDWMAYPSKDRWHKQPTSLLGGTAIFAAFGVPLLFLVDFSEILPHILNPSGPGISPPSITTVIWIGATLFFILGLTDDFSHIKPHTKLVGQILVASMVAFLGFRLHWVTSLTVDTTLTIFWIVGITNAFNLLDNMDGLCAGIGLIAATIMISSRSTHISCRIPPQSFLQRRLQDAIRIMSRNQELRTQYQSWFDQKIPQMQIVQNLTNQLLDQRMPLHL